MDVYHRLGGNTFVWNVDKAASNHRKHGVRFEEAATVFDDPLFVIVDASRNEETRDAAIGFGGSGRLLLVVHIEIDAAFIRIISARPAETSEERRYAD